MQIKLKPFRRLICSELRSILRSFYVNNITFSDPQICDLNGKMDRKAEITCQFSAFFDA